MQHGQGRAWSPRNQCTPASSYRRPVVGGQPVFVGWMRQWVPSAAANHSTVAEATCPDGSGSGFPLAAVKD